VEAVQGLGTAGVQARVQARVLEREMYHCREVVKALVQGKGMGMCRCREVVRVKGTRQSHCLLGMARGLGVQGLGMAKCCSASLKGLVRGACIDRQQYHVGKLWKEHTVLSLHTLLGLIQQPAAIWRVCRRCLGL